MSGSLVSLAGLIGLTRLLDVAGPFGIASLHCLAGVPWSGWDIQSTVVNLLAISGLDGLTLLVSGRLSQPVPIGLAVLVCLFDVARFFGCSGWSTGRSCLTNLLSLAGLLKLCLTDLYN